MKAIHNGPVESLGAVLLFSVCQIYKVWKQFTTRLPREASRYWLFSVCQIYKVWKQFTTLFSVVLQLAVLFSVCQIYKVWKQFTTGMDLQQIANELFSVCQIYKVWKQFTTLTFKICCMNNCFQYVKFIKFESNSQHLFQTRLSDGMKWLRRVH